jgi:hypothetical protein
MTFGLSITTIDSLNGTNNFRPTYRKSYHRLKLLQPTLILLLTPGLGNQPTVQFSAGIVAPFGCNPIQKLSCFILAGLLTRRDINLRYFGRVTAGPQFDLKLPATLAPIKYLSSECIMT